MQLARPQHFVAGDEMPAHVATKGQLLHEADGELRYGPTRSARVDAAGLSIANRAMRL